MENTLYYGDNLHILRDHIPDESVDLIYLDPPFNSKATYNVLFKEPSGIPSAAQITAFEDTWRWTEETERTFQDIVDTAPARVIEMMRAFRQFIKLNDMMAYLTMMAIRILELKRVLKDTGSIYLHCDPTASHYLKILMDTIFGGKCFQNEIIWHYRRWTGSAKKFLQMHDILFFYTKKPEDYIFNPLYTAYTEKSLKRKQHYHTRIKGDDVYVTSIDKKGVKENDVWTIPVINSQAKERLSYPTQKPEALLERIIEASSNEGAVVLDPFCGCGTTTAVAQRLKRNWIGIDITHLAINLIKWRLSDMFGLKAKKDYKVIGEPEDLAGAKELASQYRDQFQYWAGSLIHARPYRENKKGKGPDSGIDGYLYFKDDPDKPHKRAIVQVKSGHASVRDIRDLGHVIDREQSEIGIFITLESPTGPMKKEAAAKGFYRSPTWNQDFSRLQILTIEELLSGREPDVPHPIHAHKQAEKAETDKHLELDFNSRGGKSNE